MDQNRSWQSPVRDGGCSSRSNRAVALELLGRHQSPHIGELAHFLGQAHDEEFDLVTVGGSAMNDVDEHLLIEIVARTQREERLDHFTGLVSAFHEYGADRIRRLL